MSQKMTAWLEDWEWQCCGDPFSIGSEVEWELVSSHERDAYLAEAPTENHVLSTHCQAPLSSRSDSGQTAGNRTSEA